MLVIGLAILVEMGRPVLHVSWRVGRYGVPFKLYKFRTMVPDAAARGPSVTGPADARVTRIGRFLRRTKLDELPQLWNVLRGEMSLVGPRPEVASFAALYTPEQQAVLSVRPGITGPAQLAFASEEGLLDPIDPEGSYVRRILPRKLVIDSDYVLRRTLLGDLRILVDTASALLTPNRVFGDAIVDRLLTNRRVAIIGVHALIFGLSNFLSFIIRFDASIPGLDRQDFFEGLPWVVGIRLLTFSRLHLFRGLWRYTGVWDLRNLITAVILSSGVLYALFGLGGAITFSPWLPDAYPRSVYAIDAILVIFAAGGLRLLGRAYRVASVSADLRRVLVFGASDSGAMIVREFIRDPDYGAMAVGFIDDDANKHGCFIHGVPVLGDRSMLAQILRRTMPDEVLVALPDASAVALREIVSTLEPFDVPIKLLPNLSVLLGSQHGSPAIRPLAIEDLLTRPPVGLDSREVQEFVRGKRVIITGAGGSIGSELCRQVAALAPARLAMLDRYENGLYAITHEIRSIYPGLNADAFICDVTDATRVDAIFSRESPELVFHAAAHKHVPLMEYHVSEAVKNNVGGTRIVAEAAARYQAARFLLISTDKAVSPANIMGASKRVAEMIVQAMADSCPTIFAAVRFGNVLGSNGSVVPLWIQQIERGGPVTVTHPEVRRFFMLIPEAVQLVLHAANLAHGGEVFVLEMGEQIRVLDLARHLIRLSGLRPERDIQIVFTGLRPGEKLFEELVAADETLEAAGREKILRVRQAQPHPTLSSLAVDLAVLEESARSGDESATLAALQVLIPAFRADSESTETKQGFGWQAIELESGATDVSGDLADEPTPLTA
jgi:FlaA1/EpsC-like NDP-sugar epimerase/lipopolysaccharide/colanic/teichoic acid biosynthesis glycosyltransferase